MFSVTTIYIYSAYYLYIIIFKLGEAQMNSEDELILEGERDQLFAGSAFPTPFMFSQVVANVFDDMVVRSIPMYEVVTNYAANWAEKYYQPGTKIYDIGCSTGTTLVQLGKRLPTGASLIGIDNSPAMIEKAATKINLIANRHETELICDDVMNVEFETASLVIINYTLQFLPVANRLTLLERIFKALRPGGILFISEKIRFQCPEFQETTTEIYERFKFAQGYSQSEIAQKKQALENVLVPFTEDEHKAYLQKAGFKQCDSIIKWNNFLTLVALKGQM